MLAYHLRLAWLSVRRHPVLSALIVAGIALGVGLSTWALTVRHVLSRNPLPHKDETLLYVRMDAWDPAVDPPHTGGIPTQITYRDLRGIMESDLPLRQAGSYVSNLYVYPESPDVRPFRELVRLTWSDFFPMFEVPFRYGGPWDEAADARPEAVAVIGSEVNQTLFGGENSVGRTLRLRDREFTVVGVLDDWRPSIRVYDLTQNPTVPPEDIYIPFNWIEPMELQTSGNIDGWRSTDGETFAERIAASESVFIQMWVELADPGDRAAYQSFLDAYAADQKRLGRFQRPLDNRLTPIPELMEELEVVPEQAQAMAAASLLFLLVCALNLIGLFLGKFLARAPQVGVRRALGASRWNVFLEHLLEAELVGLAGGALGLGLAAGGLALLNRAMAEQLASDAYFRLDGTMLAAAVLLSLVAGLVAGLYPAWRICRVPPARHLKQA
ncbi:MAG TPA: ABC transporter permease [Thermoanaerobaculia bacterium]|nr:ABC transporter permease [Thermoanaerobaculia bacterium]